MIVSRKGRVWYRMIDVVVVAVLGCAGRAVGGAPSALEAAAHANRGSAAIEQVGTCCLEDVCTPGYDCCDCAAAGGFFLGLIACPPENPENPCAYGACCVGPGECQDGSQFDTRDECLQAGGEFVGGADCTIYRCPVCGFEDLGHCQLGYCGGGGVMLMSDRSGPDGGGARADDFRPSMSTVERICWSPGYFNPSTEEECAESPPPDDFVARFFEDAGGVPGNELPPVGGQTIEVEYKMRRGGASRVWDYAGRLDIPVVLPNPGDCYWMEITGLGEGPGGCRVYWAQGRDANQHSAYNRDGSGTYELEDVYFYDLQFCADTALASSDGCGRVPGECCTCPGVCTPDVTQFECLNPEGVYYGVWALGGTCDPNNCPGVPDNDDCLNAQVISGLDQGDVVVPFQNICASTDGGGDLSEGDCQGDGEQFRFDVWYRCIAELGGDLTVSTCGLADFDTMIAVYDGSVECPPSDDLACGDDTCGVRGGPSVVSVEVRRGRELLIRVGGWNDAPWSIHQSRGAGSVNFSLDAHPRPPAEPDWPHSARKNRYLSMVPQGLGNTVAFELTLTESLQFPEAVGLTRWVGAPFDPACQDEEGNPLPGDPPCSGEYISRVVHAPVFREWDEDIVHIGDCEVAVTATYAIRATMDGVTFSDSYEVSTIARPAPKYWADCVGCFDGIMWTGPNGEVNMDDITAAVQRFQQSQYAPPLTWVDVDGEVPNAVLNFTDIFQIVQGFKSQPYPFSDPVECP